MRPSPPTWLILTLVLLATSACKKQSPWGSPPSISAAMPRFDTGQRSQAQYLATDSDPRNWDRCHSDFNEPPLREPAVYCASLGRSFDNAGDSSGALFYFRMACEKMQRAQPEGCEDFVTYLYGRTVTEAGLNPGLNVEEAADYALALCLQSTRILNEYGRDWTPELCVRAAKAAESWGFDMGGLVSGAYEKACYAGDSEACSIAKTRGASINEALAANGMAERKENVRLADLQRETMERNERERKKAGRWGREAGSGASASPPSETDSTEECGGRSRPGSTYTCCVDQNGTEFWANSCSGGHCYCPAF